MKSILGALALVPSLDQVASLRPYTKPSRPWGGARPVGVPASINHHTGKPHKHKREIARRLRQSA